MNATVTIPTMRGEGEHYFHHFFHPLDSSDSTALSTGEEENNDFSAYEYNASSTENREHTACGFGYPDGG